MRYGPLKRRYAALPLRGKLTIWNTFVVLLVAIVAMVGVREGLRFMLQKELKVALRDEVYEITLSAERTYNTANTAENLFDEMARTSAGHIRHGWFLQLFDEDGKHALWESVNTPQDARRLPIYNKTNVQGKSHAELIHANDDYLAQRQLDLDNLPNYWVRVGAATEFIQSDVDNVTRIMTPMVVFVFLLAPIGGYILAGRATSPLQKIISTSRELHPNHLEDRLPLRGAGDELDQLSIEINDFLDQIANHLQRNREFVANAAHELRSPLAAVQASVDVTLSRKRTVEEYEEVLTSVSDECGELGALVNQLLVLAETDTGNLAVENRSAQLDKVIHGSLEMFSGVAEEKGVRLEKTLEDDVWVRGEATRLRQVVNNLVDNAIKFTAPGGLVSVELNSDLNSDGAKPVAVLRVSDSGVGIPPESMSRVFDRFYQVERSRDREVNRLGVGLGLSICFAVVSAYGGQINVESKLGEGTVFQVVLPLVEKPSESPADIAATAVV